MAGYTFCGEAEAELDARVDARLFRCLRSLGILATAAAYRSAQLCDAEAAALSLILSEHAPEEIEAELVVQGVGSPRTVRALLAVVHHFPSDEDFGFHSSGGDEFDGDDY
jgi:hypothetical protein